MPASSLEEKLLMAALACFALILLLAVAGERTLPLFGGDRELAGRIYKSLFIWLGSAALAFATPMLVGWFVRRLRHVFSQTEARGPIADFFLQAHIPDYAATCGIVLMILFLIAGTTAAIVEWMSAAKPH